MRLIISRDKKDKKKGSGDDYIRDIQIGMHTTHTHQTKVCMVILNLNEQFKRKVRYNGIKEKYKSLKKETKQY